MESNLRPGPSKKIKANFICFIKRTINTLFYRIMSKKILFYFDVLTSFRKYCLLLYGFVSILVPL